MELKAISRLAGSCRPRCGKKTRLMIFSTTVKWVANSFNPPILYSRKKAPHFRGLC